MAFDLKTNEKVKATIGFTDSQGRVTSIDGVPSWSTDPAGIVDLLVDADGLSASVSAINAGLTTVIVDAGAKHLRVSAEINVGAVDNREAVAGVINFGTPEPK